MALAPILLVPNSLSRLDRRSAQPARLRPEEWSDRMLKDIGLADRGWTERLPSRQVLPPR